MHCPFCQTEDTKVIDSRLVSEGSQVRRRRECAVCNARFNTFESVEVFLPQVIKRDGSRMPFDQSKLRAGLERALHKRPVSTAVIDNIIQQIIIKLNAFAEREIPSHTLGEWLMEALHEIDQVAYVRFASVHRSFQDVDEFKKAISELQVKTYISNKNV